MDELPGGIRRLTFPLPMGIRHVHCYLLPGDDGWTLVDTGLGVPQGRERWADVGQVARIVVTHFHPDHAGGGEDAQGATGSPVLQGAHDFEQCEAVWGTPDWSQRLAGFLRTHGLPEQLAVELRDEAERFAPFVRFARDPELLREGDAVDGWQVFELPGHADGHICLLRDGVNRSATRPDACARSKSTTGSGSTRPLRRSAKSRGPRTRSRSPSSATTWTRSGGDLRSRRRLRTWNGLSARAGPRAPVTTTTSPILRRRSSWTKTSFLDVPPDGGGACLFFSNC